MKPIYILLTYMILIFPGLFKHSVNAQSPDTIKQIPFIETWESGSFDTNGWSFPYMQGNWTILLTDGNPEPCAAFPGYPSNSTYLYVLESPWFDATQLNCDEILLKFDLKLESANPTGLEKFRVELVKDSNTRTAFTCVNSNSFSWDPISLDLSFVEGDLFRVRFYTYGSYSPSVTGWYIDNIQITSEHKKPTNLEHYGIWGYCSSASSTCYHFLTWEPPKCNPTSEMMQFIFDDGTAENGWAINPGYLAWIGNEFPIDPSFSGVIQSVDVWFGWGYGVPGLTIDIFDGARNLVGSSDPFTTPSENWTNIPLDNIPFDGPFYAMVKYDMLTTQTNYFGYDENGPFAAENLAWYYDGTNWDHMSFVAGTVPGVFLIRVNAEVLFDGIPMNLDSTILLGYNIYWSEFGNDSSTRQFVKRNSEPVIDTFYTDAVPCMGVYYVTAVFADSSESQPSNHTGWMGCWTGLPEKQGGQDVTIKPNPASDFFEVESSVPFSEIRIIDMLGSIRYNEQFSSTQIKQIRLSAMASGSYIVSIQTGTGPVIRKLIIAR
jgi:hypothetical protein